jgi:exopolyphosphatase/guanosine-5'-triphosphate,3'-diphosphate pyrophosphatase
MSSTHPEAIAALDIGTNTMLLLVAELDAQGDLRVVEDHCRTARLGEGLARAGSIAPQAFERGLAVLREYVQILQALGIAPARTRAVGTAVLRRAANARAFVDAVQRSTGLCIEIISEAEEAELGARAVRGELGTERAAVIDVGGGSTEYASAVGTQRLSIPIGAVVLAESGLPLAQQQALASSLAKAFPPGDARGETAVILGGTAVNLACLELGLARFDPQAAEGARLPPDSARRWAGQLAALPAAERLRLPIEPERAAILPEGLFCLAAAVERLEPFSLRVSGRGLRYGLARALLQKNPHGPPHSSFGGSLD